MILTSVNLGTRGSVAWSDYGSREEKLDYFGKLQALGAVWHGRITEEKGKT